jgi:hypothetical protein
MCSSRLVRQPLQYERTIAPVTNCVPVALVPSLRLANSFWLSFCVRKLTGCCPSHKTWEVVSTKVDVAPIQE